MVTSVSVKEGSVKDDTTSMLEDGIDSAAVVTEPVAESAMGAVTASSGIL